MEAGISGATPGSAGAVLDENEGRLMPPPHAPSIADSAQAIPRLATFRACNLTIASPELIHRRARFANKRKNAVEAMTSDELRGRPGLVSLTACYIRLTKELTTLLDRIGVTPYSRRTISTP